MKVKDLIEHLQHQDQEMDVHFCHRSPGSDVWLAPKTEGVFLGSVVWSFLHNCPKIAENLSENSVAKDAVVLMP